MHKKCTGCGLQLENTKDNFYVRKASPDGLAYKCKKCSNKDYKAWSTTKESKQKRKEYYTKNREKRLIEGRRVKERLRRYVFDYLKSHPCIDCGEQDPIVLDFDHIRDKEWNIAVLLSGYAFYRLKQEIEKCVVRCANCHRRKTLKASNSYKWLYQQ